ncbi:L,D-transpeptidase [Synechococcus sp. CS-1324]|uniref:L,D-transpeptidase n=1 Tax=Synechococcus sp. CS-1324 TaxID=2847980 RepID=UPI000DB8E135|nr:L,D-transpeptidase [Synechococcus sp. CS-1324]MCT0230949.1 L,D-transpeptidase [Synechococcus sp. CS-1324]PZV04214.1 MAG: L,D-transpeptidase [Cyanobium sp.]
MTTPMTAERFADRFRFYKDQEQQHRGVLQLHQAIADGLPAEEILVEQAPWAVTFSSASPAPPASSGGLDPRGSEEAGLIGPKIKAPVKAGDSYLLVNDRDEDLEAFDHTGTFLWKVPCLARGQGADNDWKHTSTDTPPGLYKLGQLYPDYEQNPNPPCSDTAMSYGWFSFDMEELEGQEVKVGRAGIMLHGGGSGCGWPGAWAPTQPLLPTLGCVRLHNIDLRDKVLPLYRQGSVYVGVFQEP